LIAGIAASVGVMVGSVAPWVSVFLFCLNGLDAGNWGVTTLTLGALSGVVLVVELLWERTPFHPRWAVPLAWSVAVAGVACCTMGLAILIRLLAAPKADFFGVPIGPGIGWGLGLLVISAAVLCVTAAIVATHISRGVELLAPLGQSATSWTQGWRWTAIAVSVAIAITGSIYASINWSEGPDRSTSAHSFPSLPSLTGMPSLPSLFDGSGDNGAND
jgi:hypothetical protein